MADESQVNSPANTVEVTPQLLREMIQDPSKLETLPSEVRSKIAMMDPTDPMMVEAESGTEPTPEVKPEPEAAPTMVVEPKKNLKAALYETQQEKNQAKQRAEAERKRRERVEAEKRALEAELDRIKTEKANSPKDVYDEAYLQKVGKLESQVEFLTQQVLKSKEDELKQVDKSLNEIEVNETFSRLERFQEEFPELKTRRPIAEIDRDYVAFQENLVGRSGMRLEDAWRKYHNDPAFREQMESQGAKLPEDYQEYKQVLSLHHEAQRAGHGDLEAIHLKNLRRAGKLNANTQSRTPEAVQPAAEQSRTPTVVQPANHTSDQSMRLLDINRGSGSVAGPEMTLDDARAHLKRLEMKPRWTDEDKQLLKQVRARLEKSLG